LVVGIADASDVPAEAGEALGDVVAEGEVGVALDRDMVVVADPAEVGEPPVSGEGGRLVRDAFHHVAVAAQGVDVVVEDLEAWAVAASRHPLAGPRHADAVRAALPERAGRGFDTARPAILRVPGALAVELAETLDFIQRHTGRTERLVILADGAHAGQMQH